MRQKKKTRKKSIKSPAYENKHKQKGKAGDRLFSLILLAGIIVTVCLLLYPTFIDAVSSATQSTTIGSYADMLKNSDARKIEKAKTDAISYNAYIKNRQKQHPFYYTGTGTGDKKYQNILNLSNDGIMGYIEIPEINVSLPIGHGTSSDVLDAGAGHVHGTSVPIGGKDTHSVISAHTGMQSAKLFTDIDRLKKGDRFSIHVLNEVHYYRVVGTRIELPNDANKYLQVEPGKDLVTLYTCTPYGINTHRLLVRAEADGIKKVKKVKAEKVRADDYGTVMTQKALALASIPLMILFFGIHKIFGYNPKLKTVKKKEKKKKKINNRKKRANENTEEVVKKGQKNISENIQDQKYCSSGNRVPAPDFSVLLSDEGKKK